MNSSAPAAIPAPLAALVAEFSGLSREERYELLLDFADRFRAVPPEIAARPYREEHRVTRCESEAYVFGEPVAGGGLEFHFAVENPQGLSARAWAAILRETLSAQPLAEVASVPGDVIFAIFGREVSMGRGEGLMGMLALAQRLARSRLQEE